MAKVQNKITKRLTEIKLKPENMKKKMYEYNTNI